MAHNSLTMWNSRRRATLQHFLLVSERGLAFGSLPSSSNCHSTSVPVRIVKSHKAVTSHGINTSIIVGYLSVSQRMNNMKRKEGQNNWSIKQRHMQPQRWKRKNGGVEGHDGESDVEGRGRSWWTAVALFTLWISLFSRCWAANRGRQREGGRTRKTAEGRKWSEGSADSCKIGVIVCVL